MPLSAPPIPAREVAPGSQQVWLNERRNQPISLQQRFEEWRAAIEFDEGLFQEHVYGKEEPTVLDYRQHRTCLCEAIAAGEVLALEFLATDSSRKTTEYVDRIDEQLASLRAVLRQWHGDPVNDASLPLSLREGMAEAVSGAGFEDLRSL